MMLSQLFWVKLDKLVTFFYQTGGYIAFRTWHSTVSLTLTTLLHVCQRQGAMANVMILVSVEGVGAAGFIPPFFGTANKLSFLTTLLPVCQRQGPTTNVVILVFVQGVGTAGFLPPFFGTANKLSLLSRLVRLTPTSWSFVSMYNSI